MNSTEIVNLASDDEEESNQHEITKVSLIINPSASYNAEHVEFERVPHVIQDVNANFFNNGLQPDVPVILSVKSLAPPSAIAHSPHLSSTLNSCNPGKEKKNVKKNQKKSAVIRKRIIVKPTYKPIISSLASIEESIEAVVQWSDSAPSCSSSCSSCQNQSGSLISPPVQTKLKNGPTALHITSPESSKPLEKNLVLVNDGCKTTVDIAEDAHTDDQDQSSLFQKFVCKCAKLMENADDQSKLVSKLNFHYEAADQNYVQSEEFRLLLQEQLHLLQVDDSKLYNYLTEVLDRLKKSKRRVHPKPVLQPEAGPSKVLDLTGTDGPTQEQILSPENQKYVEQLEHILAKISRKIKRLEEAEVDLDDFEDSAYIRLRRYEQRSANVYRKICELKGEPVTAGRILMRPVKFNGTQFPQLNKAIQRWINKTGSFPDFADLLSLIKKLDGLKMTPESMKTLATEVFRKVGSVLQKRRVKDDLDTLSSYADVNDDPALKDSALDNQLRQNQKYYSKKLQEVIDMYVEKQYAMNEEPEAVPDDDGEENNERVITIETDELEGKEGSLPSECGTGMREVLKDCENLSETMSTDLSAVIAKDPPSKQKRLNSCPLYDLTEDEPPMKKAPVVIEIDRVLVDNINVKRLLFQDDFGISLSLNSLLKDSSRIPIHNKKFISNNENKQFKRIPVRNKNLTFSNETNIKFSSWRDAIIKVLTPCATGDWLGSLNSLKNLKGVIKTHGTMINGDSGGESQNDRQSSNEDGCHNQENGDNSGGQGVGSGGGNGDGNNPSRNRLKPDNCDDPEEENEEEGNTLGENDDETENQRTKDRLKPDDVDDPENENKGKGNTLGESGDETKNDLINKNIEDSSLTMPCDNGKTTEAESNAKSKLSCEFEGEHETDELTDDLHKARKEETSSDHADKSMNKLKDKETLEEVKSLSGDELITERKNIEDEKECGLANKDKELGTTQKENCIEQCNGSSIALASEGEDNNAESDGLGSKACTEKEDNRNEQGETKPTESKSDAVSALIEDNMEEMPSDSINSDLPTAQEIVEPSDDSILPDDPNAEDPLAGAGNEFVENEANLIKTEELIIEGDIQENHAVERMESFEKLMTFTLPKEKEKKPPTKRVAVKPKPPPRQIVKQIKPPPGVSFQRKRVVENTSNNDDIEVIAENLAPKIVVRENASEVSADERVQRFLQNAGSSLSITVKRKRPMSNETKNALEHLKRLKNINISASSVKRQEPEIMVLGESLVTGPSRQASHQRNSTPARPNVSAPKRQVFNTNPSPMRPVRGQFPSSLTRPRNSFRSNGLPLITNVQSVGRGRAITQQNLRMHHPRGRGIAAGRRFPTPGGRGRGAPVGARGSGTPVTSRGRGAMPATRGKPSPVQFVLLD